MKPNTDQPKAPESKPGSKPECEGRFEIPAHAGSGEEIGVVAGRPQSSRGAETADPIWA